MTDYQTFVSTKLSRTPPAGMEPPEGLGESLFPFQRDLVRWALRRGKAAIFAGTGLGKTRMQLEWARHVSRVTDSPVLVLAPLAVSSQTAAEGAAMGVPVKVARGPIDLQPGINVTNYERIEKFNPHAFGGVVLDESSCIKHHDTKTLKRLLEAFAETPWKLCCTATPAPNDWTELGTHAEFLGVCSRSEMLSEYFVHDGGETQKWRLKGHARAAFWKFVASWGALVSHPRDLGHEGLGFDLEPLEVHEHLVRSGRALDGDLFALEAQTLRDRQRARRVSIETRVQACADIVNGDPQAWVVWCDLNAESEQLVKAIHGAIEIRGAMTPSEKETRLEEFARGKARVLVTKPSIAGFGLNWQHCARMAFVGVTDSWESYYQAVRRCWRFGQRKKVHVHVFASEQEGSVVANLKRKDQDAAVLAAQLSIETAAVVREAVTGLERQTNDYEPKATMKIPEWVRTDAA